MFEIPEGFDLVEIKKQLSQLIKTATAEVKPTECILCMKPQTSFCNSHSVPRMVLSSIADKGMVLQANAFIGFEAIDVEKGVNNSGTFHFICNTCDNEFFKDYEEPVNLKINPSDKIMAEIALKDVLIQLSKRYIEKEMFKLTQKKTGNIENIQDLYDIQDLDIKEYTQEMSFFKDIINNNKTNEFQLLFWKLLPYKTPIATQTVITLPEDMEGNQINNIYDLSSTVRMENMHLCVFPLENETAIIVFCHKRDRKYESLLQQFRNASENTVLQYLNWLIFKYTENYFVSKSLKKVIEGNQKLQKLSRENNGFPNMGMGDFFTLFMGYESIGMNEIPNFLSREYAML